MTYDEGLAHRVRTLLSQRTDCSELEMFGGLAFMNAGNMVCAVLGDQLVARIGTDVYEDALADAHTEPFDFTGTAMRGYVYVRPDGVSTEEKLAYWLDRSLEFVETLPPK